MLFTNWIKTYKLCKERDDELESKRDSYPGTVNTFVTNSDDHIYDDRATQWQGDGLLTPDSAPLLSSDTNHQSAPKFAKLEDGDRSGKGRQVASSVGLLHADVIHQSVSIYYFYFTKI